MKRFEDRIEEALPPKLVISTPGGDRRMSQVQTLSSAIVKDGPNGKPARVKVGDWVGFKSDIEQHGKITKITRDWLGHVSLHLHNANGFDGHYIGGERDTVEDIDRCWVE